MQHTDNDSLGSQQSRSALPRLFRPDFLRRRINFNEYNAVTVGNSGAIWTGAGSLTKSHSRHPFRTAYLHFILIELRYSLHSDRYAGAAWHVWTSASFYLWGLSKACTTMLRAGIADIYTALNKLQKWVTEQNKNGAKRWIRFLSMFNSSSFFLILYYGLSYHLNDRGAVSNLFIFYLLRFFTGNSKMLN